MSMIINNGLIRFDVPNSEANINAQHYGIKARSVGSYYMSEKTQDCISFLNNFEGDYYIDVALSIRNAKLIVQELELKNLNKAFKECLAPQKAQIEALEWALSNNEYYHKIVAPSINDNQKYLKLDNSDAYVMGIKTLILGDLMSLYIKKIGGNGYLIYIDKNPNFNTMMETNKIMDWMALNESR